MEELDAAEVLQRHHDSLTELLNLCLNGLARQQELQDAFHTCRLEVLESLTSDSTPFRIFQRGVEQQGSYWVSVNRGQYAPASDCQKVLSWLDLVNRTLKELEPGLDPDAGKDQIVLPEGDIYRGTKRLYRLLQKATDGLRIVDPYLDDLIFDYLESLPSILPVQLLTGPTPKPIFKTLLHAFASQHNGVEARSSSNFHDRFVVLDEAEVWQLGCSFNGIGKKTSTLSRVTDPSEKRMLLSLYEDAWKAATPV